MHGVNVGMGGYWIMSCEKGSREGNEYVLE